MNQSPLRIQLRRTRGWRMPPGCIKVDRTTAYGNPFRVGINGDAGGCVEKFRVCLEAAAGCRWHLLPPALKAEVDRAVQGSASGYFFAIAARLPELRTKGIGCWCALDAPCHGAILVHLANPVTR